MDRNLDSAKKDILIIDDTPENLRLLSQMLTEQGYSVRAVPSGERALESVRALPPDLILLDIRMPKMSGYEVCERLKADPGTSEIPVIFISALSEIQDKVQAFKVGGVDYITKPFQLEEVLVRTQTHLALRTLQKRLQETNQKFEREFLLAGELQANFMPSKLPVIDGWQLAAEIIPARETSGDFFDVFQLPDGLLGFLVADVVDKGVSAALFMVLSWSLIRTYATEYPTQPELVFAEVNRRILADIGAQQYVTIFYGVLNPANGQLIYSNAGHPPPLLFNPDLPNEQRKLVRTGIPLGIFEDAAWKNQIIPMAPDDSLVVCTDGITEAQNPGGDFFGEERLFHALQASGGAAAEKTLKNILTSVENFTQLAHQYDDIAVVVLQRDGQ